MKERARGKRKRTSPSLLQRVNPKAAAIDCGASEHYVAVPPERDPMNVRCFRTFTADLHRLADWLVACGITTVAMEATGVFWIPVYEILEARKLESVGNTWAVCQSSRVVAGGQLLPFGPDRAAARPLAPPGE